MRSTICRVLLLAASLCSAALAADAPKPSETIAPLLQQPIGNVPGKTFTAVNVNFGPSVKAEPHRHGDAFVYAYVLSGSVRSQLEGQPAKVYGVGESWFEPPGAHHTMTENMSSSEPARLLVVFIAATGASLKTADKP